MPPDIIHKTLTRYGLVYEIRFWDGSFIGPNCNQRLGEISEWIKNHNTGMATWSTFFAYFSELNDAVQFKLTFG